MAYTRKGVIEIDPDKDHSTIGCVIGHGLSVEHRSVTKDKDEALFLTLLHEVGHFLVFVC